MTVNYVVEILHMKKEQLFKISKKNICCHSVLYHVLVRLNSMSQNRIDIYFLWYLHKKVICYNILFITIMPVFLIKTYEKI